MLVIDIEVLPTGGTEHRSGVGMLSSRRIRTAVSMAVAATAIVVAPSAVQAQPNEEVFDRNDQTWLCHPDGFPAPHHCQNIRSQGQTGLIMVFPPDDRGPAEGVSDSRADDRPCPHDPGSDDGTWWEIVPGVFVCHHRP